MFGDGYSFILYDRKHIPLNKPPVQIVARWKARESTPPTPKGWASPWFDDQWQVDDVTVVGSDNVDGVLEVLQVYDIAYEYIDLRAEAVRDYISQKESIIAGLSAALETQTSQLTGLKDLLNLLSSASLENVANDSPH